MNQKLQDRCNLLAMNRKQLSDNFKWESDLMNYASATIYTGKNQQVDIALVKKCEALLKSKTGAFSEFRGNVKMVLLCKMAMAEDAEAYFEQVEAIYHMLHKSVWMGNEYKIMAAMTILDYGKEQTPEVYVERTNEIYARMKKEHSWLTSDEDIPFAAMLAVSGLEIDFLVEEMEKIYSALKDKYYDNNAVQSLSHVLCVIPGTAEEKCAKFNQIFDGLKQKKHKYGSGYELAILGALVTVSVSEEQIVQDIIDADDYLKTLKGFGDMSLGSTRRRMYAVLQVLDEYRQEPSLEGNMVLTSMLAITILAEICMLIAVTSIISTSSSGN